MDLNKFLEQPNKEIWKKIRERHNEDPNLVENQIKLFRNWLRNERHLPKDVDSNILRNFIRYCQCDLEAAKKNFERYMVNRAKFKNLVAKYEFNENYFKNLIHRCVVPSRYLTPEGFRIGFLRLPEDVIDFDFEKLTHYCLTFLDIITAYDSCAGYTGLYDFQNVTTEFLGKINVRLLMEAADLMFNVAACHIEAIHFINLPKIPETIFSMMKRLMKDDIVRKIFVHKTLEDLKQYFPDSTLPKEYGGSAGCIEEFCETAKEVLLNEKEWCRRATGLTFTGPIPQELRDLYDLEDYSQNYSLRHLSID